MGTAKQVSATPLRIALVAALAACWMLPAAVGHALRIPEAASERRVQVHAFWNGEYLCLAARVPDAFITGTSTQPMSTPEQDDAIEFDFLLPTGQAHRLIISAAEGMTMLTRDPQGRWRSDNAWVRGPRTLKYAVSVNGTLNHPQDRDVDFAVECALPWEFLGGVPKQSIQEIGFNVVNWMQGDNEGVVSWSPYVTSNADVGDVARWGRMLITRSSPLATAKGLIFPCPFNPIEPLVDGNLDAMEWMTASSLSFAKPEPQLQPVPATLAGKSTLQALMAVYRYDWEPARFWKDHAPATIDQPQEGAGPWYRGARVDWHQGQLTEVKRAGIDVILVHYQGDPESRRTWSRTGLDRLTQALKEIRAAERSYPLVGLYLDTAALKGVDLKSEAGKQLVYTMIRDFFQHVPAIFRAQLGARPEAGVRGGVPVLLGEPAGLADWDEGFMSYVEERLGPITWLGSSAWQEKGVKRLYARVKLTGAGLTQDTSGEVTAFTISPGYCPPPGTPGDVRSRHDGRAYRTDWQRVTAAAPALVVIDSWNDFARGTEIAPSRQWGHQYVDATRTERARLGYDQPRKLRLLQHSLPEVLLPGATYQADLLIENDGTADVITGNLTTVDHRITHRGDNKLVYEWINAQGLQVRAGEIKRTPVTITTKDQQGKPLPPGDYLFTLVATKSRVPLLRSKLVAREEAALSVPFTVGPLPDYKGTVIVSSLPALMDMHGTESVVVRLRNDGAKTWKAADTKLTYHLTPEEEGAWHLPTPGFVPGEEAALPRDVPPGEAVSVMVRVKPQFAGAMDLKYAEHAPPLWPCRVAWAISHAGATETVGEEAAAVIAVDRGVVFESALPPSPITAGAKAEVPVAIRNGSTEAWPAAHVTLSANWYTWDGRTLLNTGPLVEAAGPTPFPSDVAPGQTVTLAATVTAPSLPGCYWLVCQVNDASHGRWPDLSVTPVTVTGGKFRALDLSEVANCVAVTTDGYRTRGDFDGAGTSFPAECLPPDQSGARNGFYADGYWASPVAPAAPFVYPSVDTGMGTAVACDGQTFALGGNARRVHLLAASVTGTQELAATLKTASGSGVVTVRVPGWREAIEGLPVAGYAPYVRTLNGDDASAPAYLYHLALPPVGGSVTALQLPKSPGIRILAITVEE